MAGVNPDWNAEQKALYLHDYLDTHCQYDLTYSNYNAYNALIDHSAVCQGYSEAYNYLLSLVGVECDVISSDILDHAWNLVTIDGTQYYVDCTWDDPAGNGMASYVRHGNMLRSKAGIISEGHASSSTESFEQVYTEAENVATDWYNSSGVNVFENDTARSSTKYDSYYWSSCNTVIPPVGDLWAYTTESDDELGVYAHDYRTREDTRLTTVDRWGVIGNTYGSWNGNFASLSTTGSNFVLADATTVSLLSTSGVKTVKYTLSSAQQAKGRIYSMLFNEDTDLYDCDVFASPNDNIPVDSFSVDLATHVTGVSIAPKNPTGNWGSTIQLTATVAPSDATNPNVSWSVADESIATVDADGLITLLKVGTTSVTAVSDDNTNASATATLTVTPVALEDGDVVLDDAGLTYDGSAQTPTATVTHNDMLLIEGTDYTITCNDNISAGTGTATIQGIGAYTDTVTAQFSIARAAATVTAQSASKIYGDTDPEFTAEVSGLFGEDTLAYSLVRESGENAGIYGITPTGAEEQGNYLVSFAPASLTIGPKPITISAGAFVKTYGSGDPAFTVTADGLVESDELSFIFTREPGEDVGVYSVSPQLEHANGNYIPTFVAGTLTIERKAVTVSADNATKTYGASDPAFTATVSGTIGDDTIEYALKRAAGENVGEYAITPEGETEQGNYLVSFASGILIIVGADSLSVLANDVTATYDGKPHGAQAVTIPVDGTSVEYSVDDGNTWKADAPTLVNAGVQQVMVRASNANFSNVATCEYTITVLPAEVAVPTAINGLEYNGSAQSGVEEGPLYTLEGASATDAGSYSAVASLNDSANYRWTDGTNGAKAIAWSIAHKNATVAADDAEKAFGESDPAFTAAVSGLVEGESPSLISYEIVRASGEDAGTYSIIPEGDAEQGNYFVSYEPGILTIGKAQAVVPSAAEGLVYEGIAQTGVAGSDQYTVEGGSATDAGSYTATVSLKDPINYEWEGGGNGSKEVTWSIARAAATIAVDDAAKTYGEDDPEFVVAVSGFKGGDTPSYTFERMPGEDMGTYGVAPVLAQSMSNYDISLSSGTLTIQPKPITVKADDAAKAYGDPDPELTAHVEGLVGDDSVVYTVSRASGEHVGTYDITATGESEQGNYLVTFVGGTFTIAAANTLVVTANVVVATYDGKPHGTTATASPSEGTTIEYSVDGGTTWNAKAPTLVDAGTLNVQVRATNNDFANEATCSYTITVNPASVVLPASTAGLVYNGQEQAGVAAANEYTVEGGSATDAGSYTATATLANPTNYRWTDDTTTPKNVSWSIARKPVTVKADNVSRGFDEPDPEFTATVEGLVNGDNIEYDKLSCEHGEEPGEYNIMVTGKSEQGNYVVTFEMGTFTIEPTHTEQLEDGTIVTIELMTDEGGSVKARIVRLNTGTATSVVIPATIDGYDVASVAAGAFYDESNPESTNAFVETVVLESADIALEDGALQGLSENATVGFPEGSDEQKAIDEVGNLASQLPANDTITLDDAQAIADARAAYDALTETQKMLASAALTHIEAAERALAALSDTPSGEQPDDSGTNTDTGTNGSDDTKTNTNPGGGSTANTSMEDKTTVNMSVGTKHTVGSGASKATYAITASNQVAVSKTQVNSGKASVPATVKIGGKTFKVTSIAKNAFKGRGITSVAIGKNVKSIGANAFAKCKKLTKVTGCANVTSIGTNAFSGDVKLAAVPAFTKLTSVGTSAFLGCKSLKTFKLGAKVTTVGAKAFQNCKKLAQLTIKSAKLKKVGKAALKGTAAKLKVKVPKAKKATYAKMLKTAGISKKAKVS
ncbi:MAG: MBG domain-containing protein [Coriobacteriia bacterium]|nr:MBG domain-containing protein [Coriobacteriia bacterium]